MGKTRLKPEVLERFHDIWLALTDDPSWGSGRHEFHGQSRTLLYGVWRDMIQRCVNPKHHAFARYGGRGVRICDEWRFSFVAFSKWSDQSGYAHGLTIDRVDNDGNYEPRNCRFVTNAENSRNRSTTKLTPEIATKIVRQVESGFRQIEISHEFGISRETVSAVVCGRTWADCTGVEYANSA